ncbi:hypothetical protein GGR57DRAFT_482745 [Xylariaceae sp. FL1272]|nr:hypothetical protein GGR57DRAFT_482745 [Xylariaceae sp. FL1272]
MREKKLECHCRRLLSKHCVHASYHIGTANVVGFFGGIRDSRFHMLSRPVPEPYIAFCMLPFPAVLECFNSNVAFSRITHRIRSRPYLYLLSSAILNKATQVDVLYMA